jgi:glycosyltransferase involved in cell wall biosynthesis
MKVVIDLQGAQASGSRHRGIGRYSIALTKAVLRNRGDHDVHLLLSDAFPNSIDELREKFRDDVPQSDIHVWTPVCPTAESEPANAGRRRSSEKLRELFIRNLEPDVVHISSLFEGMHDDAVSSIGQLYSDIPTTVSLFDLIPLINRNLYLQNPAVGSWYMNRLDHLRRADALLAISESARQEAIAYLGTPADRAINIGTAADPQFARSKISSLEEAKLRETYGLKKPFVMYTGGIDPRKNIEALIRSYASLPGVLRRSHQLAIVCSALDEERKRLMALAADSGLAAGELVMTGYVPEDDLIALYNLTALFVFPSLHEGFGLPALEAMHCGAPVIASNRSSLPEVVQLPEALFDPYDEAAIAGSIARALKDSKYRTRLKANSEKQAKAFSWDECGRRAIRAFEGLQEPSRRRSPSMPMTRPRLAYVSPMPPAKSGIANYTTELLPHLSRHYRIDAVVKDEDVSRTDLTVAPFGADVVSESTFRANARDYDRIIYQFGNSDHHDHMFSLLQDTGGVVVLHDFFLSGILAHLEWTQKEPGAWAAELYRSHGYSGPLFRKNAGEDVDALWKFPCSRSVVEAADELIVHSNYSLALARKWYGDELAKRFTVIPHLREPVIGQIDKVAARARLGLGEGEFIVCSFGFVSPTKLSQKLLEAWSAASLKHDPKAKLIFVGENHSGEYGHELDRMIREFGGKSEISISGWNDMDTFRTYLAATDVAVQLRTLSRGETSGAVLDCMNFGVPLIVNANGSMADLSPEAAIILPDEFSITDLSRSLDRLHSDAALRCAMAAAAKRVIAAEHSPASCAEAYMRTIERSHVERSMMGELIGSAGNGGLDAEECGQLSMEAAIMASDGPGRLLVDVSELAASDAGSGIQRVVRNILTQLLSDPDPELRAEPVYTDPHTREFRFARAFTSAFLGVDIGGLPDEIVDVTSRDTLLFLDLNPVGIPALREKIAKCKRRGTKCVYVVYDLLTVRHPEYFIAEADVYYRRWLDCVAEGTAALCISKTVAVDLRAYFEEDRRAESLQISHFPLGSDLDSQSVDAGPTSDLSQRFGLDFSQPTFLMVGTIEPRKKHEEVLDAFEILWAAGEAVNLLIVGKEGWSVDGLATRMAALNRREPRFSWSASVSDSELQAIYGQSTCLIAASLDEGYGLPLVEGAARGLHLIARDIPVFREICEDSATYFSGNLGRVIGDWLGAYRSGKLPEQKKLVTFTWKQSADALLREVASVRT